VGPPLHILGISIFGHMSTTTTLNQKGKISKA
jgi:hypothetical protein